MLRPFFTWGSFPSGVHSLTFLSYYIRRLGVAWVSDSAAGPVLGVLGGLPAHAPTGPSPALSWVVRLRLRQWRGSQERRGRRRGRHLGPPPACQADHACGAWHSAASRAISLSDAYVFGVPSSSAMVHSQLHGGGQYISRRISRFW